MTTTSGESVSAATAATDPEPPVIVQLPATPGHAVHTTRLVQM